MAAPPLQQSTLAALQQQSTVTSAIPKQYVPVINQTFQEAQPQSNQNQQNLNNGPFSQHLQTAPEIPVNSETMTYSSTQTKIQTSLRQQEHSSRVSSSRNQEQELGGPGSSPTGNHKEQVVAVGDSNFKGLRCALVASHIRRPVYVSKFAYHGATASHIRHYIDIALEKKPDVLIIHAGTNDVWGRNRNDKCAEDIASELIDTALKAKQRGVRRVLILSVLPVRNPESNARATDINNILKILCREKDIQLIDNSNITLEYLRKDDDVHLNGWGFRELALNFAHYIDFE